MFVARNKDGKLYLFKSKPIRNEQFGYWSGGSSYIELIDNYHKKMFKNLQWKDNPKELPNVDDITVYPFEIKDGLIKNENLYLDLGAITKGYATEEVGNYLESIGFDYYLINAGGNIKVIYEPFNLTKDWINELLITQNSIRK